MSKNTVRICTEMPSLFIRGFLVFIIFLACGQSSASAYPSLEYALKRANTTTFFIDYNGDSTPDRAVSYGAPTDIGLVGDFDGDTISDLAVYRGGIWYIDYFNDTIADSGVVFGDSASTDTPIAADFNGDGKADIGIYRSNGFWYLDFNLDGAPDRISPFGGLNGDIPVVADFNGDENVDRAIYRQGHWYTDFDWNGSADAIYAFGGGPNDRPIAADFNKDGMADLGIFREGVWYIDFDHNGSADLIHFYGAAGDRPLVGHFNTDNSIFVRSGAMGIQNGAQNMPFATINAALASNPQPSSIIRIAAGNYPERVSISQRSNLAFQGAGPTATHINPTGDVFTSFLSLNITLRDLHFVSQGADTSTPGRGIVNLGTSMVIEHVSTAGNWMHGVIAAQYFPPGIPGSLATLSIDHSKFDQSRIGNGIELDAGATATVTRSSASNNGTQPASMPPLPAAPGGRGVVLFNNAAVTLSFSDVSRNYDGGILLTHTANAILRNNNVVENGTSGIYFEMQTGGEITGNFAALNGTRGTRGLLGYNGIEIASLSSSPLTIRGNTLSNNTTNGIFIGGGTVNVINNHFVDNYLGMTLHNETGLALNATLKGNIFDVTNSSHSVAIHTRSEAGSFSVTMGGSATSDKNMFRNYGSIAAINCNDSSVNTICGTGWNIFVNSSFPVQNCTSCSP